MKNFHRRAKVEDSEENGVIDFIILPWPDYTYSGCNLQLNMNIMTFILFMQVFKYLPRYYLYKHAYFYPPLKRFPVQVSIKTNFYFYPFQLKENQI